MEITTKRLLIRRFMPEDGKDLWAYLSREDVVRYEPYNVYDEAASNAEAARRSGDPAFLAVCLRETGQLIGNLYFSRHEPEAFGTWEIGYVFHPNFGGMGYATEAARAMISYGFAKMGVRRIVAECNTENTSSWLLLERLGMRREGHFRKVAYFKTNEDGTPRWFDAYAYAILADEAESLVQLSRIAE